MSGYILYVVLKVYKRECCKILVPMNFQYFFEDILVFGKIFERISRGVFCNVLFLFLRKKFSMKQKKNAWQDCTAAGREMLPKRPAAGGDSFLMRGKEAVCQPLINFFASENILDRNVLIWLMGVFQTAGAVGHAVGIVEVSCDYGGVSVARETGDSGRVSSHLSASIFQVF